MKEVIDEFGFVKEGEYILVIIPAVNGAIPLQVKQIENKGARILNYGPLPVKVDDHASGVVAAGSTTTEFMFKDITGRFPPERAPDIFYHEKATKLVHAFIDIKPHLFRIERLVPTGTHQYILMDEVSASVERHQDFGYLTGVVEQIFLPSIHVSWQVANETNMDLHTYVSIEYAEYEVSLIKDADTIADVVTGAETSYRYTFPAWTSFDSLKRMFSEIYKIEPIPLYRMAERARAVGEISKLIEAIV